MEWTKKLKEFGLMPAEGDCFAPLSETDVQELESMFGAKFPEDYRLFLLRYGVSDFEEDVLFPTPGGGVIPGIFFGNDMKEEIVDYEESLPKLMVPINEDGGGNLICLCLRKEDFGAIYFKHHSIGWDNTSIDIDAAKLVTCFRLSDSFTKFICGLASDE